MKVSRFTVNPFGENTYIVWDEKTKEAIIIDPGMSDDNEKKAIDNFIEENHLKLIHQLFTHLHLDHAWGYTHIQEKYGLVPKTSEGELVLGKNLDLQSKKYGLPLDIAPITEVSSLSDGDKIRIGDEALEVIQVTGHSPGGLVFYSPTSHFLISGDVLFDGSIGRTDLDGGNFDDLINGIRNKLLTLPNDTLVCPGHGGTTTIGDEKTKTPFLK